MNDSLDFGQVKKYSWSVIGLVAFVLFLFLFPTGRGYEDITKATGQPVWFGYFQIGLGVLGILGLVLTLLYKKIGLYLVVLAPLIDFFTQIFFGDFNKDTAFTLFMIIGIGGAVFYPRLNKFS